MTLKPGVEVETRTKGAGYFSGVIVEAAGRKEWIVNVISPADGSIIDKKTMTSGQLQKIRRVTDKKPKSPTTSALIPSIFKLKQAMNDTKSADNVGYQELVSDDENADKEQQQIISEKEIEESNEQQHNTEEEQPNREEENETAEDHGFDIFDDSSISEDDNDGINGNIANETLLTGRDSDTDDGTDMEDEDIYRILLSDDPFDHDIAPYDIEETEYLNQTRSERYKTEKQNLLDSEWKVDVDANYNCKGTPKPIKAVSGAVVVCKHGTYEGHRGILLEKSSHNKWMVEFDKIPERQQMTSRQFNVICDPNSTYTWKIVEDMEENSFNAVEEYTNIGVVGFDPSLLEGKDGYFKLFQYLWPGKWKDQLQQMNIKIQDSKKSNSSKYSQVKLVSQHELWKFIGIIIYGGAVGKGGIELYEKEQRGISPPINIGTGGLDIMSYQRLNEIKEFFPFSFHDTEAEKKGDEWYKIGLLVDGFNYNRKHTIASSCTYTLDESMSAFKPRTSAFGRLPNISLRQRKPRQIGTEFKDIACTVIGVILFVEIMRARLVMHKKQYYDKFGATVACTIRLMEGASYCGLLDQERVSAQQEQKKQKFYGDSWFASVRSAEQAAERNAEFVGPVKTNHKHFPKRDIEQKMENWSTGSYMVLKCKTPNGASLYAIGFKYSKDNVMSFICTENAGSTKKKQIYQVKYSDEFGNRLGRNVELPDVIGRYFSDAGLIDQHNQARQGELDLEYNWPTQDCWFRLNTTFIGFNTTDTWKIVKFYTHSTDTIKEFADVLASQCINNNYSQ